MFKKLIILVSVLSIFSLNVINTQAGDIYGQAFADIENNVFREHITNLYTRGVINGYGDGNFLPENYVTRGELSKFIVRGFQLTPNLNCENFIDTPESNTFFVEITTLKCLGIVNGYSDKTFRPDDNVSRGEAMKFIIQSARTKIPNIYPNLFTAPAFKDVPNTDTFFEYIQSGFSNSIINGFDSQSFAPQNPITRGALAKIIDLSRGLSNNLKISLLKQVGGASLHLLGDQYLQKVDLRQSSLQFYNGNITDEGLGQGAYSGNNPTFVRQGMDNIWVATNQQSQVFSVVNSAFFKDDSREGTEIAFAIKKNGAVLTDGYAGGSEYFNQKKVLQVWPDRAEITDFNEYDPYTSITAPDALVSLSTTADKGKNRVLKRTIIGLSDSDKDGSLETVLILSSNGLTQARAVEILELMGATQTLMLDGGNSTQLKTLGESQITSTRTIPQALVVVSR